MSKLVSMGKETGSVVFVKICEMPANGCAAFVRKQADFGMGMRSSRYPSPSAVTHRVVIVPCPVCGELARPTKAGHHVVCGCAGSTKLFLLPTRLACDVGRIDRLLIQIKLKQWKFFAGGVSILMPACCLGERVRFPAIATIRILMHPRYVVTACVLFVFGCVADAVGEGLLWLIGNPQADVVTLSVLATAISGAALLGIGALADAYGASGRRECNLQALLALLWLSPNRPTQRVDADLYWKAVGRGAPVNAADAVVPLLSLSLIGGILLPLWLMTS